MRTFTIMACNFKTEYKRNVRYLVRIWNTSTGQQMHCLTGHTSTVRCMALNASTLVTGSRDWYSNI